MSVINRKVNAQLISIGHGTIGIGYSYSMEITSDGFMLLSTIKISGSLLRQESCKLIG